MAEKNLAARRARLSGLARLIRLLPLAALLALTPGVAGAVSKHCLALDVDMTQRERLPRTTGALRLGQPLTILAIGSSSTAGAGATSDRTTYPSLLAHELRRRYPGNEIQVIKAGVGGELLENMLYRLKRLVVEHDPQLVIFQTGTNDALARVDLDQFGAQLEHAFDWLRARGIDVLAMDLQFYPAISHEASYAVYVDRIRQVARRERVPVFRRYDIMRYWSTRPESAGMLSEDSFHLSDRGYGCIAELLAETIAQAVPSRPAN